MAERSQAARTPTRHRAELVHHLPDELCVRVRAPHSADAAQLYEQVRGSVNRYLQSGAVTAFAGANFAGANLGGLDEPLALDVHPRSLVEVRDTEVLQPLQPAGRARATPVSFDPEAWHCYYRVPASMERVRELTNLLNLAALGRIEAPGGSEWSIAGGSPNWLTSALPFSCGSPAAWPRSVKGPVGAVRWEFGDAMRAQLSSSTSGRGARVIVAVLDACPTKPDDRGNPVLRELLDVVDIDLDPTVPPYADSVVPWLQEQMPDEPIPHHEFAMPDHGLFVAGIVHDIAPEAELHLIRVLNDDGVGDLYALEDVLRSLPDRFLPSSGDGDARLVVNLSLGSAVPVPRRRYFQRWLPRAHEASGGAWPADVALANELLEGAHAGLLRTMQWLYDRGVLVVAAAGNDGLRRHLNGVPPPPRYPAYYEPVLAVAAADADGSPASYSNRGDVVPFGNGVTTFGGSVSVPGARKPPVSDENAILGVYSSPTLPDGSRNETGWVRWAGTSFSTPIISGLAARLWQQDAGQSPAQLMQRIRDSAHNITSRRKQGTDPDGPLDAPYLEARQR